MLSQIRNNLFVCAHKDLSEKIIKKLGITAVLNLAPEIPEFKSRVAKVVTAGFADSAVEAAKYGDEAVAELKQMLQNGETVLAHCKQGASRTPHVVSQVLAEIENRDYFEVYDEVKSKHPRTMDYSIGQEILDKGLKK